MRQSIKQQVMIRIALIFLCVIVTGLVTVSGMNKIKAYSKSTEQATEIHSLVLTAERAHYSWVENLCSAVALGTEFTGSKDYKGCVLGKWFYQSDLSMITDSDLLRLIEEMKPIHQAIHESAQTILDLNSTDPAQARQMYLEVTKANVDKLVSLLDQVAGITEEQVKDNQSGLFSWVSRSELISIVAVVVILIVSALLMLYVMKGIVGQQESGGRKAGLPDRCKG